MSDENLPPDVADIVKRLREPRQGIHESGEEELKTWEQLWEQCQEAAALLARRWPERQQVSKNRPICEHGRNAWADDCGMCELAGTDWAMEPQPTPGASDE